MTQSETLVLKRLYDLRSTQDFVDMKILRAVGLSDRQLIDAANGLVDYGLVEWMPHEEHMSPTGGIDDFVAKITDEGIVLIEAAE